MPKKLNIAVIFGGRSGEHEVSLVSASSVIKNLNRNKYNVIPIGITKEGQWIAGKDSLELLKSNNIPKALKATLTPDTKSKALILTEKSRSLQATGYKLPNKIDVVFPVLHGTFGEDGTIQGLLELSNAPYVGAGVLGSALAMDKISQKNLCGADNILVPDWVWLSKKEWQWTKKAKIVFRRWLFGVERRLGYPMFVKPSNLGSSVGISKVNNRDELIKAINLAIKYDRRVLIEQAIDKAMEIEVAVLGNDQIEVSTPGQIVSSNEFYDYDAKYVNGKAEVIIPAPLPKKINRKIEDIAMQVFKLLDCAGMGRADFLVTKQDGEYAIYFSELNTIPGFTSISMYPKLWQANGLGYKRLLDILIKLAIERHRQKNQLTTVHKTKDWYK